MSNKKVYVRPVVVGCYGKKGCSVGTKSSNKNNCKDTKKN